MDREPEAKKPRLGENENGLTYPVDLKHCDPANAAWYQESLENPCRFWEDLARQRIRWMKEFDTVREVDMTTGSIKWFIGGKLNVSGM